MRRHDHRDIGIDSRFEGLKLDVAQPFYAVHRFGQIGVAVFIGIAMAWEMLAACDDSRISQAVHHWDGIAHDVFGCRTIGAIADNRVCRVRIDVEHWGEVDVEA